MTDLNKEKEADTLPEVAHLLEQCKHRDLTLIERAFVKGARYAWQEKAKAQAVPEGCVLVTEDQAKDAARLDFMLQKPRVVISDVNYDENYDKTGEGFCVNEVYWIDGWDRLTETVHQTKREAIDKAMEASESGAEEKEKSHDRS
ncbi:hypothetical protein ACIN5162_1793 [Acinetobacter baumannii OIFC0162]|uniref:hypothetical protein n=1 Tax=Acinetobacter baumannii TaxID=470 RepID=UPI00028E2847|nr:hypothetical protein [Acinetobacter baumannii]EHU2650196.1 hypothetical protein [Acinetobacter baumannii]EHU2652400.1 hypothetical protein [Acinetobacter baumannii]EKK06193.1 hypothetical protein ACIN5162_1793 [Acinetobacter baumannii OIFC0162]TPS85219.1 hypothetical protein FJU80_01080 [Acinetobacter baumannii]TPT55076.1 hypothetical protein FJU64_09795 [Acinetobacter baumannii]